MREDHVRSNGWRKRLASYGQMLWGAFIGIVTSTIILIEKSDAFLRVAFGFILCISLLLLVDVLLRIVLGPTFELTAEGVRRPGFLLRPRLIPYGMISGLRLTRRGGVDRLWILRSGGRLRNLQWLHLSITNASSREPLEAFARDLQHRAGVPLTDRRRS